MVLFTIGRRSLLTITRAQESLPAKFFWIRMFNSLSESVIEVEGRLLQLCIIGKACKGNGASQDRTPATCDCNGNSGCHRGGGSVEGAAIMDL